MIELVVLSGKGGTGKTSIIGSLAVLAQNIVIVDGDVDAADLHLILPHQLNVTEDFSAGSKAAIIEEKCTACGICEDFCRFDAIKHEADESQPLGKRYWINQYACEGCGLCAHLCPEKAIDFSGAVSGQWFYSETPYGPLWHARLGIAQSNSGKLVSLLRQKARQQALELKKDFILIDGPPGIGCPVISSITGADYVLIVTEPSLSARHDMERLVDLAEHFNIAVGLCINRYDINEEITEEIEHFARDKNIPVLSRIEFNPEITKAQVAGKTIVECRNSTAAVQIRSLWDNLQNELKSIRNTKQPHRIN
jgi:MinD superfamily P-loop ATPase